MKREIKFRLIFDGKIVGYEKHSFDSACGILHSADMKSWYNINVKDNLKKWIWHTSKEQYTGLKDKNGKEIYEGDIIRDGQGGDGVVKYNNIVSSFMMLADGQFWFLNEGDPSRKESLQYTEIIGNTHEETEK